MLHTFNRIPVEMRDYAQWIVWRYEDRDAPKPVKVPYSPRTGKCADVTRSETWTTFDEAVAAFETGAYSGIGFVLTHDDPYAFIDLDDTKGDKEAFERQLKIYQEFDSYAELSPSGKGLHVIVRGGVEAGRKRSGIEVYSAYRYMTMTGNVYRDAPIREHNGLLQVLWQQMGGNRVNADTYYAGLEQATETDEQVFNAALNAANGEKFAHLYNGDWQQYYASQSEADFALVDIIAFYSDNRAQIARMFRASGLGKRDKAKRDDYLNYMLNRCFDNKLPPVDIEGLRNMLEARVHLAQAQAANEPPPILASEVRPPANVTVPDSMPAPQRSIYSKPPGLLGDIAEFIYAQAARPVPEIALAGAIGFMAGIVGRAYNVSGTGLNQYVLLLAPTGTGKEAIAGGIDKLIGAVSKSVPAAVDFVGPAKIASEQALIKYMSKNAASFVSVVGEFGMQLKLMASPHAPPHLAGLMALILDLYNKSGEGKVLRPSIYSDREKNTSAVLAPAFTWLGETTPETFYGALDESMITSGLLPRFTAIEYKGDRPPLNPAHNYAQPRFDVIERLGTLCAAALNLNAQHKAVSVRFDAETQRIFDAFDVRVDGYINNADRELRRQLWNRAHIKAMKLAALVAVGIHPYEPTVTPDVAQWAIDLIVADVENLLTKFDAGEIGGDATDETRQVNDVIRVIADYAKKPFSDVEKYVPGLGHLHAERVIPYSYVQRRLASSPTFRKDKRGATDALRRALGVLCERGDLQEVPKPTLVKKFNVTAKCYMVNVPGVFGL